MGKATYIIAAVACSAVAYVMLRDIFRQPDFRVTRRMVREAEAEAYFGNMYSVADEDDDDEFV